MEACFDMKLTREDKAYLRQLMKDYLKKIPDATPKEKADLKEWVMTRHSPYDNQDGVCDNCCHLLDFISDMRFWKGFCSEQPKKAKPDGESQ